MLAARRSLTMNNKPLNKALVLALAAVVSGSALADGLYGAAMGSLVMRDSRMQVDTGYGGQLVLGIPLTSHLNLEPNIFASHNDVSNASGSVTSLGGGADLNYFFQSDGDVRPFILAGLGMQRDGLKDLGSGNENSPFLDLGAGLTKPLTSNLGFRGEVRAYAIRFRAFPGDNTAVDIRLNLGLTFGGNNRPAPIAVREAAPAAPARQIVRESEPVTPAPVQQTPRCAKAPKGQPVDDQGCLDLNKVQLKGVNFVPDSAKLQNAATGILDAVVNTLKAYPGMKVEVAGYTDSRGDAKRNVGLSERRANSVRGYLISKGIAADRLTSSSHGAADPVDSNDTRTGRANNRRVEFKVK